MITPPKGDNVDKKRRRRWIIILALAVGLGIPIAGVLILLGYFLGEYYHP